jgi:plasmid replication initiation protein
MAFKTENESKNFVIKSNALVEARYRLSLQESQIILWLLTQIRLDDEDFKPHKLDIVEFAKLVQVDVDSKYRELRKITRQLMQRVMEIYEPETQKLIQVAWLSSAEYEHKKGYASLEFSPKLKPYLLQLKSKFTKIDIIDTLKLKSIYAIRIFELLLQYISVGFREISISDLRAYCGIKETEYADYFDLKRYVIEKAKTEINSKTEYKIDYSEIKESRKFVAIEWTIKKKDSQKENQFLQIKSLRKELRSKSVLIQSLMEYGYGRTLAKRFIENNDEEIIKNALNAVNIQIQKNHVKNAKAMLRTAIKERWKPDIFKNRKKKANINFKGNIS